MIETMPNEMRHLRMREEHVVPLPACCPVSGNPRPGSLLRIRYRRNERVLEVYSLDSYLAEFIGGHASGIRTMEAMIGRIADDCAQVLGVPVTVAADLVLEPGQRMVLVARAGGRAGPRGNGSLAPEDVSAHPAAPLLDRRLR